MRSDNMPFWSWQKSVAVAVLAIAAVQFYRANRPHRTVAPTSPVVTYYTRGTVVDAPVSIKPLDFVSYRIDLNRRADLRGEFLVAGRKGNVEALVFDAENFESWKVGREAARIVSTGEVPGGKIARNLLPGAYYLVLSNRGSEQKKTVTARFRIE